MFEIGLTRSNRFSYSLYYHHFNAIFQNVFNTIDCKQRAEYQDGISVVNGIMAMHQQNHLDNVIT